jgi:hypothetical protein
MHPRESHRLRAGKTIWVWVVRLGRGRLWPGRVDGLCEPSKGDFVSRCDSNVGVHVERTASLRWLARPSRR